MASQMHVMQLRQNNKPTRVPKTKRSTNYQFDTQNSRISKAQVTDRQQRMNVK